MLKKTKKLVFNSKIFRLFIIPAILFSSPLFYAPQDIKAGIEFQWNQNSGYRRLKWIQKQNKKRFRNTIYFFFINGKIY